jgi:cellulose synthase/poly-beta-1,6-N-acetylglucosamine synthase-like glycosyltransferase
MCPETAVVSVVIPTYARPGHLQRCLAGLEEQSRPADEVVVVWRRGDRATSDFLSRLQRERVISVAVDEPTQAVAMTAGVCAARGDIIAFTDDDAVPRRDWLAGLLGHFEDIAVGAVGGRDVLSGSSKDERLVSRVGLITRWGRLIGNHHIGTGPAREVTVLKGANMAFRRRALAIPSHLRGAGAQIHQEVAICLWARKRGWKIIYDPGVVVDHYPAARFDADRRLRPEPIAIKNIAYNYSLCLLSFEPRLYLRRAVSGLIVGDKTNPGLVRAAGAALRREPEVLRRMLPSLSGHLAALVDIARGRRVKMVSFD